MKFQNEKAQVFVPDSLAEEQAFERVTHLGVGAHQDDLEFMAWHGILTCYRQPKLWFAGVTCTNGAGSPRSGLYAQYTDEEMMEVRLREQNQAAAIGEYAAMVQLNHSSSVVKDGGNPALVDDLEALLRAMRPEVVYTHNLADKHDTHIGVALALIAAIRRLPEDMRPRQLLGCEVWRDLDWLMDDEKVNLDVGGREHLENALMGVFDSQIAGGKRYDLATAGRRRAQATYNASHGVDKAEKVTYAMDLTPLVRDATLDVSEFILGAIKRFESDVAAKLKLRKA